MTPDPAAPLHRFQARIRQTGPGQYSESAPQHCSQSHDLTRPRAMLVGWETHIDPPHRIWICRSCGEVIHNLAPNQQHEAMRPVRLDHCDPHQPADLHERHRPGA